MRFEVGVRDEVWAEVWVLRLEVEVLGLGLGSLRCEVKVGVLRFEVEVWGLRLGLGVWLLRPEVEVWGSRLGFLRCEVEVGVLRFEVGGWGLRLGTLLYPAHWSVPSSVPPVAGKGKTP